MDQAMGVCDWYLFHGVGNVILFQRIIKPRRMGLASDEEAVAAAMPQARVVVAELNRLLDQSFFGGELVTLADLMVAPHVDFFAATAEWDTLAPTLRGWRHGCVR